MQQEWPQKPSGVIDYLRKHWQGRLSLAMSYWMNTFIVSAVLVIPVSYLDQNISNPYISMNSLATHFLMLMAILLFAIPLTIWQVVGVWRSAGNRIIWRKKHGWSYVARLVCVVAVVQFAITLQNMSKDFEAYISLSKIALGISPERVYSVQVIDSGSGILIEGPFEAGVVEQFHTVLRAAPDIFYVQLESEGGWIQSGVRLHQLIQEHELATYVGVKCYSACSIAYIGGTGRYIKHDAKLGFHRSYPIGESTWSKQEHNETEKFLIQLLRGSGVSKSFLERVRRTPSEDLWVPDIATLGGNGVITHVLTPDGSLHEFNAVNP